MADIWRSSDFLISNLWGPPVRVAGYVYRGLGLKMSMRGSPKGRRPPRWTLIHLNTGHAICTISGHVADAFPIATKIAECGDWDFDGLHGWKNRDPELPLRVRAIFAHHEGMVSRSGAGSDPESARAVLMARTA